MRRRFILFISLLILCYVPAFAKTDLLKIFLKIKTLEAEFVQENYYTGIDSYSYKGKVYIERGHKALWDYLQPVEFYLLDGKSVLHYSADLKQAEKIKVDLDNLQDPTGMLLRILLDSSSINESFNVTETDDSLVLIPKNEIGVKSIALIFKDGLLYSLKSIDADLNSVTITFNNTKQNQRLSRSVFEKTYPTETEYFER